MAPGKPEVIELSSDDDEQSQQQPVVIQQASCTQSLQRKNSLNNALFIASAQPNWARTNATGLPATPRSSTVSPIRGEAEKARQTSVKQYPVTKTSEYSPAVTLKIQLTTYFQAHFTAVGNERQWEKHPYAGLDTFFVTTQNVHGGFSIRDPDPAHWVRMQAHANMTHRKWQSTFETCPPDNTGESMFGIWMLGKHDGSNEKKSIIPVLYNSSDGEPDIIHYFTQNFPGKKAKKDEGTAASATTVSARVYLLFMQEPVTPPPAPPPIPEPPGRAQKSAKAASGRKKKTSQASTTSVRQAVIENIVYPSLPALSSTPQGSPHVATVVTETAGPAQPQTSLLESNSSTPATRDSRTIKIEDSSVVWETTTLWKPNEATAKQPPVGDDGDSGSIQPVEVKSETSIPPRVKKEPIETFLQPRFPPGWQLKAKEVEEKREKIGEIEEKKEPISSALKRLLEALHGPELSEEDDFSVVRQGTPPLEPSLPPVVSPLTEVENSTEHPGAVEKEEPKTPPRPKRDVQVAALSPPQGVRRSNIARLQPICTDRQLRARQSRYY